MRCHRRLEPLTLLSAVATHTTHIGLVATASSTYNSPFNLARRFASLDHISGGRAGWNVVTSFDTSEHFKVAGPINLSRSRQDHPVIFQAGVSEDGRNLAAHVAEGNYAPGGSLDEARDYYGDIKRRAAALGRDPDHVVIFTGASPVVGGTDEEAAKLSRDIYEADNDFDRKLGFLGRAFGAYDFSQHDLDAPFPDVAHLAEKGGRTRGLELVRQAKEQGLTLRRGGQATTYRNAQELFVVADELGFDVGWVARHHAPLGGGGLPSPWTFLAHAAARTKRIRLSTAITVLPLENPVRLAEDVSVVDLLSGGRVEIGVGSGGSEVEYAAFGRDVGRKHELTSEGLQVLRDALANRGVGATGFTIQPPAGEFTERIWQGVFSGPGAEYAARGGSNLLLNRAAYGYEEPTDEVQRPWADAYLAAWDQPRPPRIGGVNLPPAWSAGCRQPRR